MLDDTAGPDAIEKFMRRLKTLPFPGTPGKQWSYRNPGMATLGRIAEVLTKQTYDDALEQRILRPLGLNATTYADRMILGSTAVGHLADPATGTVAPAPVFRKYYGNAPAGSTLWLDVAALLGLARMHLDGGLAADGRRVLSVAAMQTPQYVGRYEAADGDIVITRGAGALAEANRLMGGPAEPTPSR